MKKDTSMIWLFYPGTLLDLLQKGIDYYVKKYGEQPNLIMANPAEAPESVPGLTVKPDKYVLKGHIWIGSEEQEQQPELF